MKLIVGLGNPGTEYAGTRHNAGFAVIDLLSRRHGIPVTKRAFRSLLGEGTIGGERVLLACPQTYMNLSGEAVGAMTRFYKIPPEDVIVLLDDVALPLGRLRLRFKGSAGGHNGLANILTHLGTQEVPRIRIGVGAAKSGAMIGHVLSRFRKEELPAIEEATELAADAVEYALENGFEAAMNQFNINEKPAARTPQESVAPARPDSAAPDAAGSKMS